MRCATDPHPLSPNESVLLRPKYIHNGRHSATIAPRLFAASTGNVGPRPPGLGRAAANESATADARWKARAARQACLSGTVIDNERHFRFYIELCLKRHGATGRL